VGLEFLEGDVDRLACGDHQPDALVVGESVDEVVDRVGGVGTGVGRRRDCVLVQVEGDDLVACRDSALDDDLSHPSESDQAQLHGYGSAGRCGSGCGSVAAAVGVGAVRWRPLWEWVRFGGGRCGSDIRFCAVR